MKHGIDGVAYATIISQIISAVLVVYLLSRTQDIYRLTWNDLRIDKRILGSILAVGFPTAVQSTISSFSNVFVQSYVNYFGSAVMAGWNPLWHPLPPPEFTVHCIQLYQSYTGRCPSRQRGFKSANVHYAGMLCCAASDLFVCGNTFLCK